MSRRVLFLYLALFCFCINRAIQAKVHTVDIIGNGISGLATINPSNKAGKMSTVHVVIDRLSSDIENILLGSDMLEAWLVDHGTGSNLSKSSASVLDNDNSFEDGATAANFTVLNIAQNAVNIADVAYITLIEAAPYALSLGSFKKDANGDYILDYKTRNSLKPYDYLMVTIESGGNEGNYDPRPGGQVAQSDLNL